MEESVSVEIAEFCDGYCLTEERDRTEEKKNSDKRRDRHGHG